MSKDFMTEWWKCKIPDEWSYDYQEGCVSFASDQNIGALQVSAACKDDKTVSEIDLRDFAQEHIETGAKLKDTKYGDFSGYFISYAIEENEYWQEFWLKCKNIMLYITYNCDFSCKGKENDTIVDILDSLKINIIKDS